MEPLREARFDDAEEKKVAGGPIAREASRTSLNGLGRETRTEGEIRRENREIVAPEAALVPHLFSKQAALSPDAVAICVPDGSVVTYKELESRSSQLAAALSLRNVGIGDLVGVCVERSIDLIVSLLGVLKAGAAYLPLDPSYPPERLRYMLQDAKPTLVLCQDSSRIAVDHEYVVCADVKCMFSPQGNDERGRVAHRPEIPLMMQCHIYVIYTSGSTGRPKGTAMTHGAMADFIPWHRGAFRSSVAERVLQFAPLSFDVAFQEVFSTLCLGGTLVLLTERVRRDPAALCRFLCEQQIHRLFVPPMMLQAIAEWAGKSGVLPQALRDVITAGEQLRITPEIRNLLSAPPECRLHNHYGPTETHVASACTLSADPTDWPTYPQIGVPVARAKLYVMNEEWSAEESEKKGEIWIGGSCVASGYLKRPELTAERFVADPAGPPGARAYRTGDCGQWGSESQLEYLGRNDYQVKIRGFRVELGEVETQLLTQPGVLEAVVIVHESDFAGKQLIAYIRVRSGSLVSIREIQARLGGVLPDYMVPVAFVVLERFPTTPNGKLDRAALPTPDASAYTSLAFEPPEGDREGTIAEVWQTVLGVPRLGRNDNFFELGGHSLLIVEMLERLAGRGIFLSADSVYDAPTVMTLAAVTGTGPRETAVEAAQIPFGCDRIEPSMLDLIALTRSQIALIERLVPGGAANIQDIYPVAPLQEGILFHSILDRGVGDTYSRPMLFSVDSRQRIDELAHALQAAVDKYDVFRTAFFWEALPSPVQVVLRTATLATERIELDAGDNADVEITHWMAAKPLDLQRAPLLKLEFAQDPRKSGWYAVLRAHHLICDNESLEALLAEVISYLEGKSLSFVDPTPYRNHVARALASNGASDASEFFRAKLGDVSEPTLPFGVRGSRVNFGQTEVAARSLSSILSRRLRQQARRLQVSAAAMFHAAWALVVSSTSGRDDVVFGSVLVGRLQSGAARTAAGLYINTLPLRVRLQGLGALSLVQTMHQELSQLVKYEQSSLVLAQQASGVRNDNLFGALINFRHQSPQTDLLKSGAAGIVLLNAPATTNYPVVLSVGEAAAEFTLEVETERAIDPRRLAEYVHCALVSLIESLEQEPNRRALLLSVLPEAERAQILGWLGSTQRVEPVDWTVHQFFEAQVRRTPHRTAVSFERGSLTYSQLNARANQLARYLRRMGVGPEKLVGLCLDRSAEIVIGLLAILKAGAAYLPVDTASPAERRNFILQDAMPAAVLTTATFLDGMQTAAPAVLALDSDWPEIQQESDQDLDVREVGVGACNLAYVIYTSGSTGIPKGTMIEHRQVTRLFAATEGWLKPTEADVWTLFHSVAFDFSVWEIWGALFYGGKLVVVPQLVTKSPKSFYELLSRERVTILNQTPSAFVQLANVQGESPAQHGLRVIIFGGEALEFRTLAPWVKRNGVDSPQLINMYGITETTVHVTYYKIRAEDVEREPHGLIGCGIADLGMFVLNSEGGLVPIGVPGEIYVGGAGVARGYLSRAEISAQRFIADFTSTTPGGRLYRSGDIGRLRPTGVVEYLGRNDHQVKIRGFRIELGEIEATLEKYTGVKQCVVLAREDVLGEKRLVAYVVTQQGREEGEALLVRRLRTYVEGLLPAYMVPAAYVVMEALPLTTNGKLDRRRLPQPTSGSYVTRAYQSPEGEMELMVAGTWGELLALDRVGREDDFFELGGHSLLAIKVIGRLRSLLDCEIPLILLFEQPVLREFARSVEDLGRARKLIDSGDVSGSVDAALEAVESMSDEMVAELTRSLRGPR